MTEPSKGRWNIGLGNQLGWGVTTSLHGTWAEHDRFSDSSEKKQHKTSSSYCLKSIKCIFLSCSQCTYVSCLLSSEKCPWPAIQAWGKNRLDLSSSCPSYPTAVTRVAGSATWKPWDRWQQGQQGSWSTFWSLPLLEQVQNAIFKRF